MSLRINTNTEALNGYRNVNRNNAMLATSLTRLSSGLRINKASDDAAGLVISEQMRAQITGLNQAISNSETAVNMTQTAEGSLDEMNSLLKKVRSLALHAANAAPNDVSQLTADQSELDNAVASITRIASTTQFGTKKLLDGTLAAANSYDTTKVFKFDVGSSLLTRSDYTGGAVSLVIDSSAQTSTVATTGGAYAGATASGFTGGSHLGGIAALSAAGSIVYGNGTPTWAEVGVSAVEIASGLSRMDNGGFTLARAFDTAGDNSLGGFFAVGANKVGSGTVGAGSFLVSVAATKWSNEAAINVTASLTIRVGDVSFGFADGTSVNDIVASINNGQSVYTVSIAATSAGGGLVLYNNVTGQAGAARDFSVNAYYSANLITSAAGGAAASTVSLHVAGSANFTNVITNVSLGHRMNTTINLDGAATVTGVTLGSSNNDVSNGVFTTTGGSDAGTTIRQVFGDGDNHLKSGAAVTISVAGKDYSFANTETVTDMLNSINSSQSDYVVSTDRDAGLIATRAKLGDGGAVSDLSFRVTDVAGNTGSMTALSSTAVDREVLGSGNAVGLDKGVNVAAHLAGLGLPGQSIGLTSSGSDASVLKNAGYGINVTIDQAYAKVAKATVASSSVSVNMTKGAIFQIGANNGQLAGLDLKDTSATRLGIGGDSTNTLRSLQDLVSKQALVNGYHTQALSVIDKAIDDVTSMRGNLGAFQANALESGLNSLRTTQENLSSAESTIRDTDFAKESSVFAKNQILVQSSTAMLAQANQLGQGVLKLLG